MYLKRVTDSHAFQSHQSTLAMEEADYLEQIHTPHRNAPASQYVIICNLGVMQLLPLTLMIAAGRNRLSDLHYANQRGGSEPCALHPFQ